MKQFLQKNRMIISYLIVGVMTTVVSLGVYYGLVLTCLDPNVPWMLQLANVLSWIAAVSFAYITNRMFVFRSKNPKILPELVSFVSSRLFSLGCDMLIMFLLVTCAHGNDKIAKIVVQVVVTVLNYVLSKYMVFRGKKSQDMTAADK